MHILLLLFWPSHTSVPLPICADYVVFDSLGHMAGFFDEEMERGARLGYCGVARRVWDEVCVCV